MLLYWLCYRAYRAVEETDQEFMGSKLVVSFANPAKHYDTHPIRPQNNSSLNGPANSKLTGAASAGATGHVLAQRTALLAGKPGFGGRVNPSQAFAAGMPLLDIVCKSQQAAVVSRKYF